MVKEYEEAKESQHRQAAIMNTVQLLEKLVNRLSPWYIRHEKLVSVLVSLVGILSGIITIVATIVSIVRGK
jgi:hypothetical protein